MTTGPNQAQAGGNSHQLSMGTSHSAAGPSPHTLRRGKCPARRVLGEGVRTSGSYFKESVVKALRSLFHDCYQITSRKSVIKEEKHWRKLKKIEQRNAGTIKLNKQKMISAVTSGSGDWYSKPLLC